MGYALVVANLGGARYRVYIDLGEGARLAAINAGNAAVADLQLKIVAQEAAVAQADAAEEALRTSIAAVYAEIVAQMSANPTAAPPSQKLYEDLILVSRKQQAKHEPIRMALRALQAALVTAQKKVTNWYNLVATSTRDVWCVDYTTTGTGYVRTLEIDGEQDLIVLAPYAAPPVLIRDGGLRVRDIQSPAGAFYNAAMLPGWQKYRPQFRYGTISNIDYATDRCSVTLANATSTAQGLDINQSNTLNSVPIVYSGCNSAVFVNGDRVVVQFTNRDWTNPRVIGFLDNPKACSWACVGQRDGGVGSGGQFSFRIPEPWNSIEVMGWTWEYRLNGGSWEPLTERNTQNANNEITSYRNISAPIDLGVIPIDTNYNDQRGSGAAVVYCSPTPGTYITLYGPAPYPPGKYPDWPLVVRERDRWIYEFRALRGGVMEFNAAVTDNLSAQEDEGSYDFLRCYVRAQGGISFVDELYPGAQYALDGYPTQFLDYTLTGETS